MDTGHSGNRIAVLGPCIRADASSGGQRLADEPRGVIVLIDRCEPTRSYLVRCLKDATDGAHVIAFASATEWLQAAGYRPRPSVVPLCNSGCENPESEIEADLLQLANLVDVPVIAIPGADAASHQDTLLSQLASTDGSASWEALNSA